MRGGVLLLLLLAATLPGLPAAGQPQPPPLLHPTGRPDAISPPEGSVWIAAETVEALGTGGAVVVGARPLPGLVLSLHQTAIDDGSAELIWRLSPETATRPAIIAGATGLGGPAADRGVFLGLGRRWGPLDLTAGLSWRTAAGQDSGGWPDAWGSVRWQTAHDRLALQAEAGRIGRHRNPRLTGQYRMLPWMDVGLGAEVRGGIFATLTLTAPVAALPPHPRPDAGVTHAAARQVWVQASGAQPLATTVGRAAADHAPADGAITIHAHDGGLPGAAVTMMAADLARAQAHRGSPAEIAVRARFHPADPPPAGGSRWRLSATGILDHGPGADDSGWVSRLLLDAGLEVRHPWGLRADGALRLTLDDTTDSLPLPDLERAVRSDLAYHAAARLALERLTLAWHGRLAPGLTALVEAGHFEEMFGGAGGEVRWQPFDSRHSLNLELHHVWKREPGHIAVWQGSGRVTGFVTSGYDLPGLDAAATLSAGRFLGGDRGVRLGVERWFDNGATIDGAVTWSGGLTLGLRLRVPLGRSLGPAAAALEMRTAAQARDAGQRLERATRLSTLTRTSGFGRLAGSWPALLE